MAGLVEPGGDQGLVSEMCTKLREKFASPEHAGSMDVVAFLDMHDG